MKPTLVEFQVLPQLGLVFPARLHWESRCGTIFFDGFLSDLSRKRSGLIHSFAGVPCTGIKRRGRHRLGASSCGRRGVSRHENRGGEYVLLVDDELKPHGRAMRTAARWWKRSTEEGGRGRWDRVRDPPGLTYCHYFCDEAVFRFLEWTIHINRFF
jgi:hypothetical protein